MTLADIESTPQFVERVYSAMRANLRVASRRMGRPLSLAEKLLLSHMDDAEGQALRPGESQLALRPDRVALQDVLGQTAMLQFMQTRRDRVAVPSSIHCDHLVQARVEGGIDLVQSMEENSEVYDFLKSAAARYGLGFWAPGAGIIHQVVLENYALPGRAHHRYGLAHAERGRAGRVRRRSGRRGRGGGDGRAAVGGAVPPARGRVSDGRDERLDCAEGRYPAAGRGVDRIRRDERDHRVHRAGGGLD